MMKNQIAATLILTLLFGSCASRKSFSTINAETLLKTSQSWNGTELPSYSNGTPEITILKISIPSGASLKPHKHPYINAGVLVKGELTVMTETDQTLHLKEGDSIAELVNTWHYGKNTGSGPAEIIVFYAGIKGEPITVLKENQ